MKNLLIKLSELAVSLLRFLPTKPEQSKRESPLAQGKELERNVVQVPQDQEEEALIASEESYEEIVSNSESFSESDNWIGEEVAEQSLRIDDVEDSVEESIEVSEEDLQWKGVAESKKSDLSIDELGCSIRVIKI